MTEAEIAAAGNVDLDGASTLDDLRAEGDLGRIAPELENQANE